MRNIISLQQKIAPELIELIERRYTILRHVSHTQPVGRRTLANQLQIGERVIRSELDFLKGQGLLEGESSGVKLTVEGERLIPQLSDYMKHFKGLTDIEKILRERLGLGQVIVIPGDADKDAFVKKEMGRCAARYLMNLLVQNSVLAVTGGTTVGEVAEAIHVSNCPWEIQVVPARGGLGEDVEIQANTIAAKIAKKLAASYRLLHVPDNISEEAVATLSKDPNIKSIMDTIKTASILIHGIGNASELSVSRGDSAVETRELLESGAVGEAFGHYFSRDGTIVKTIHSLGIRLRDLKDIEHVIGVAGGSKKAEAILAVVSNGYEDVLVTDEAAGREIIKHLGSQS